MDQLKGLKAFTSDFNIEKQKMGPRKLLDQFEEHECHHLMVPVTFTRDGESVTVYCSAASEMMMRRPEQVPDFGLYADRLWKPVSRNEFISWPDFNLPTYTDVARRQIIDAYIRALYGERVEIGCLGGHGRTGTILACMAVLAGWQPGEAIEHCRKIYCKDAVETLAQINWVVEFAEACCDEHVQG